jgi:hypothetical protein
LSSQAVANGDLGKTLFNQLQSSRSLLETDKAEPNTWFALSSTELFLNISVDLATEDEFPVIQLTDSSHTVIIPHDLRKGTTDLIINGLHMQSQSKTKLEQDFMRTYASNQAAAAFKNIREHHGASDDAPITAGPYPYTTFIPLFVPDASPQRIYARLGESKDDLLIGFLPHELGEADGPKAHKTRWSEGHTQVILEDRDLDFAWSLSCFVQGDELACHLPRPAIQQVYKAYATVCPTVDFCPGGKDSVAILQESLSMNNSAISRVSQEVSSVEHMKYILSLSLPQLKTQNPFATQLRNVYLPTLQVWVVQSDTDDENVFYSAEPARIDFFPLSEDYWKFHPFKAWHFAKATPDEVGVQGCNYFPEEAGGKKTHTVTFLGSLFDPEDKPVTTDRLPVTCAEFEVPTLALTRGQLVFRLDIGDSNTYPTPFSIPTYKLAPQFSTPVVKVAYPPLDTTNVGEHLQPTGWTVDFSAKQTICGDSLEIPDALRKDASAPSQLSEQAAKPTKFAPIVVDWLEGTRRMQTCDPETGFDAKKETKEQWDLENDTRQNTNRLATGTWSTADKAERIHLRLTIPRELFPHLSEELRLVRHSSGGDVVVGTLPNLRKLLFPTRLSLEPLGPTQFALRGDNTEAIGAVVLQNGGTARIFPATSGVGYSLVTVPAATADATDSSGASGGASSNSSTMSVSKNGTSTQIKVTENNQTTASKPGTPKATPPKSPGAQTPQTPADAKQTEKPLAPGTYTVLPLVQVGEKSVTTVQAAPAASATPGAPTALATPGASGTPAGRAGSPATGATAPGGAGAGAKPAAQKIKTVTTKTPVYEPIPVSDVQGKPLVFTVADPKKAAAKPDLATTPAACAVPCIVQGCTTSLCPPAAPKPAASATP